MVAKAKTKQQDDTVVEFRVAMMSTCTHKGIILPEGLDRSMCTDSGSDIRSSLPNWSLPLAPFHQSWIYMVEKSTLEKQTS